MRNIVRKNYLNIFGVLRSVKPGIHIINSHYVTPDLLENKNALIIFEHYLKKLNKLGTFVTLETATSKVLNNNIPKKEVLLTFTFDDGFEECYTVIAPLLEKYNCRGAFFVNANYISSNEFYQKEFNKRVATSTKKPMNWNQVIDLHKRGHLIGSHGLDHYNFAELKADEIESQLKNNKEILEKKLNYKCEYFAWTYGQLKHFPIEALDITEKYHKYIFSGTNYKNYFSYDGRVINRRHQEAFWPILHSKYFLTFNKKI